MPEQYRNIDEYINSFPEEIRAVLLKMRLTIQKAAPQAAETISYGMPAYKLNGPLVYFGGHEKHIGFYPTASGIEAFKKEIAPYKSSKGAIQFPLNEPIPYDLVGKITRFRADENLKKAKK